ncbi:unnamed protein product [Protopolystoma xenopodis]|uniref:UDP-N-acetylglucosamine transferase subunit ALG14 n=1 Tax=Protopolystoma xenopodis TaxID=117903 RepID=A0A3S5FEE0_9PLAT|nr:unnamed protein product [Protopolystoma xenopodis]
MPRASFTRSSPMLSLLVISLIVLLLLYLFYPSGKQGRIYTCKTMIVIGSGGHTSEMVRYTRAMGKKYAPKIYVLASSDKFSEEKVLSIEASRDEPDKAPFVIKYVPRSREVGQSYLTSIFTTLWSFIKSFEVVLSFSPDLVLCNGPGTCVPICFSYAVIQLLRRRQFAVVFVESICRTASLSLTGKILYYSSFSDVIVQWPKLKEQYPRAIYLGLLS